MHHAGCSNLISVQALALASKARFFRKHEPLVCELMQQLRDSLSGISLINLGSWGRSFWMWPPIVASIFFSASDAETSWPGISSCISCAVADAVASDRRIQRAAYAAAISHIYPSHDDPQQFYDLLARRCHKYFNEEDINYSLIDWVNVFFIARSMSEHIASCLFKTVVGGWITARRTQAPSRACIFCCLPYVRTYVRMYVRMYVCRYVRDYVGT